MSCDYIFGDIVPARLGKLLDAALVHHLDPRRSVIASTWS